MKSTDAPSRADAPPLRGMRILHLGNIANNAYQNARILNEAGVTSDVLADLLPTGFYHAMSCPEWEDGRIERLPFGFDVDFPDWARARVRDFSRPPWFAQGPLILTTAYLRARLDRSRLGERLLSDLLGVTRRVVGRRGVKRIVATWKGACDRFLPRRGRAPVVDPGTPRAAPHPARSPESTWIERFRTLFPDRGDQLSAGDLHPFLELATRIGPLLHRYDIVIGYSTDGIFPMLVRHPCYVAYEHGTLRAIPFEDSPVGRLTALAYRTAAASFVTNCDNIVAVKRLGLRNAHFVPHPMNDALLAGADGSSLRRRLTEEHGCDFMVFHPSRQHWDPSVRHGSWEKGNDIFLRGFSRFVRDTAPRALCILVRWGRSVQESERLVREEKCDRRILWLEPMPNRAMLDYICAADAVADQFWLGTFGGIAPKAMGCARPVLLHYDPEVHSWCFPESPPVLACRSADEVFEHLRRLYDDRAWARSIGASAQAWYRTFHSESRIRSSLLEGLHLASMRATHDGG